MLVHESEQYGYVDLDSLTGVQTAPAHLTPNGHHPGDVDGVDGPKTRAAVRAFQDLAGLAAVGVTGPLTRESLKNALDQLAGT